MSLRLLSLLALTVVSSCGHYPSHLTSHRDIAFTSKSEHHINASQLGLEDFPALVKFTTLYEVDFDSGGGTDEKLRALAQVGFTNLTEVVITACPLVTDRGVVFLAQIPTIAGLGLRGTSISDKSVEVMTTMPRLRDVNLTGSTNVTLNGFLNLVRSDSVEEVGFSCGTLTDDDLIQIMTAARRVNRIDISDPPEGRLDAPTLRKVADTKGIKLYVTRDMVCSPL